MRLFSQMWQMGSSYGNIALIVGDLWNFLMTMVSITFGACMCTQADACSPNTGIYAGPGPGEGASGVGPKYAPQGQCDAYESSA